MKQRRILANVVQVRNFARESFERNVGVGLFNNTIKIQSASNTKKTTDANLILPIAFKTQFEREKLAEFIWQLIYEERGEVSYYFLKRINPTSTNSNMLHQLITGNHKPQIQWNNIKTPFDYRNSRVHFKSDKHLPSLPIRPNKSKIKNEPVNKVKVNEASVIKDEVPSKQLAVSATNDINLYVITPNGTAINGLNSNQLMELLKIIPLV